MKYILVIDAGTTGVRAIIFDRENNVISHAYVEIPTNYPELGWAEQDPTVILDSCINVGKEALSKSKLGSEDIKAIGITNQRSTSLLWDKETGRPVCNAITWQDTRSLQLCKEKEKTFKMRLLRGIGSIVKALSRVIEPVRKSKFGKLMITISTLSLNPGTSLSNIGWILENIEGVKERAEVGELLAGTIDTWLIWNLTGGTVHATDFSNASSTNMFDTFKLQWSDLFLDLFDIPKHLLPEVKETSGDFGETDPTFFGGPIPITGVVADQQSALFAETCFEAGDVKCTHGTGTFIDMNVGTEPVASFHKLVPLIGWSLDGEVTYMLEGYLNTTGSAVQWLCEGLQVVSDPSETEALASSVEDTGGVFVVPALQGLSSPYWDPSARGLIIGLTRGTRKEHVVRALLEAIGFRCKDIITAMEADSGVKISSMKTDGNASRNNFLLQFMAELLNVEIERPEILEATSLGAAYFAGLKVGYWKSKEDIKHHRRVDRTFEARREDPDLELRYLKWKKAIDRSFNWA